LIYLKLETNWWARHPFSFFVWKKRTKLWSEKGNWLVHINKWPILTYQLLTVLPRVGQDFRELDHFPAFHRMIN